uniref:Uncharacterized protein n=1 Tax=Heliothis virescens TaxID=7102 RepID=A0A2A4J866_HELVI
MLRTTISRIKKVWTLAFVPRLLRGDQRFPPGKFDIISYAVQRKSPKSTTPEDGGKGDKNAEQDIGADYIIKCNREPVLVDTTVKGHAKPGEETAKEVINPLISSRLLPKESHCEKCQRIIDKAFGRSETTDMLTEQYCSHSVNIEETRRKINESELARIQSETPISDNRVQLGVFKTSREPVTNKLPELDHCEDIDTEKGKIAKGEHLDLVRETLNTRLTIDKDHDLTSKLNNDPRLVEKPLPLRETASYEEVDRYVHDQEKLEHKALNDLHQDDKLSQMINDERRVYYSNANNREMLRATDMPECDQESSVNAENQKINNVLNEFMAQEQRDDTILQATTAKETEEQLAQKVEHIDETPLVEAHKPKIEGFNVSPRVLGEADPQISFKEKPDNFHPNKTANMVKETDLDEVAKRCLDIPIGKIDEILLNEMERLGVSENQARSPAIEDDLVQMDEARGEPKGNTSEEDHIFSEEYSSAEKLLSSQILNTDKILPRQVEELENVVLESAPEVAREEEKHSMHPNQVFIYPYHRQALCYHTKNAHKSPKTTKKNMKSSYYFMPAALHPEKQEKMHADYKLLAKQKMQQLRSAEQLFSTREHDTESEVYEDTIASNWNKVTLESTLTPDDSKSSTGQKNMEIELLQESPPAAIADQTYYSNNIPNDEYSKPDRYGQGTDEIEIEKHPYYSMSDAPNRMWNEQYHQQKEDNQYPQKMYAKELNKTSPYYQPMNNNDYQQMANEWGRQQIQPRLDDQSEIQRTKSYAKENYNSPPYEMDASSKTGNDQEYQPEYKHRDIMYETGADPEPCYLRNMSPGHMWENQQTSSDSTAKQMQDNYYRGTDEASNELKAQTSTKEEWADMNQTNSANVNTTQENAPYSQTQNSNFCVPDGTWHKTAELNTTVDKTTTPVSFNKTNINVSDGIWDENVEPAEMTKTKKNATDKVSLPEQLVNQQLDPYYVLTCNETCPISPKPAVGTCDNSNIIDTTETIFEKAIKKSGTKQSNNGLLSTFDNKRHQALDAYLKKFTRPKSANVTANLSETFSLPNLSENVALSELLKRVRERSRIIECRNDLKTLGIEVEPAQAKCSRKSPRCPPTGPRSLPRSPIPPPSFGLPTLKRFPNACKPSRPRTRKCTACDLGISGLHLGPNINAHAIEVGPEMVCEMNDAGVGICAMRSKADLTEEVVDRLQSLGRMLGNLIHRGKTQLIDIGCLLRKQDSKTMMARDFEPWSPIPSWPEPKQPEKKLPPCPKGCKVFPPPRVCAHPDPPCEQKPCSFPKKSFSMLDCFAVSLGDHQVYDLGDF